jgi:Uncharacterized homolog of phage Mu protein gp47
MYENLTVESIKSDILGRLSADIDKREGSFTNDMVSAVAYEIWKSYQALDAVIPIAFVDETSGEYIDKRCAEYGITRKTGTKSAVELTVTGIDGTVIPAGKVFLTYGGQQFETDDTTIITSGAVTIAVTAAENGGSYNVPPGAITLQLMNLNGITSVTNAEAAAGGSDAETDAALTGRLYDYLRLPATSGNAAQYRLWALESDGVGDAKVTPLWNGPGTVKVIIVGNGKGPVDTAIVNNCRAHIEASRPVGAFVTTASAEGLTVNVAAIITLDPSATTAEAAAAAFSEALEAYLKGMVFVKYTLVYNRIAYMLLDIPGVIDYSVLTINGGTDNIPITGDQIPVLGNVEVTAG